MIESKAIGIYCVVGFMIEHKLLSFNLIFIFNKIL